MTSNFKYKKFLFMLMCMVFVSSFMEAQNATSEWKLQLAVGFNNPIDNEKDPIFYTEYVNLPTVNIGLQHMFTETWGAKLDGGFNRASNAESSSEFKLNYTRINVQAVYDFNRLIWFWPEPIAIVAHAGPGVSFTKPLGNYADNTYTFLNALAGLEVHYGLSRTLSVYGDVGYVFSFSGEDKYDPHIEGYSFNGDMMYFTIGISISLSGCAYC
ncbi:outer membrane beta-barrel protein [Mangrovimonas sp. YM274]|uniref:outer membrane beta-barrel protein n=1 Tax=Mangrovimonas sp. YM274 TaxID=3070660 RepID=UPI0027DE24B1|nr:outer membrane beta-barrel protein [Mangrovimonas sp. YM274]WMI68582.1 outer membrane beta-barrel protein [Mangrovimonas sp. YM274]